VEASFSQRDAQLSPDGKWLAYISNESGRYEVYVQSFPQAVSHRIASRESRDVAEPRWRADGRELYYRVGGTIMAVPVSGGDAPMFGTPETLFTVNVNSNVESVYAVSPDGERILTADVPPADPAKIGARLILNWPAALEP